MTNVPGINALSHVGFFVLSLVRPLFGGGPEGDTPGEEEKRREEIP